VYILAMDNDFLPWIKYPDLSLDRLCILAELIRSVRHQAIALHEPENGDGDWCLGCRIYERTCFAIREAAKKYDWLGIIPETKTLQFSFSIGSMPFRFYRGDPDDPPSHYLAHTFGELHCIQLALEIEGLPPLDKILRLAVETSASREVSVISVVESDESGEVKNTFGIPLYAEVPGVTPMQTPPVSLPPAVAPPLPNESQEKKKKDDAANTGTK
jgi:hypothetical protein